MKHFAYLVLALLFASCATQSSVNDLGQAHDLPLERIKLPEGFAIEVWVAKVKNARSMCLSPSGTLFVGTRDQGNVYAIKDTDGDNKPDKVYTLARKLNMPNGVAFRNGSLYVAEVNRILRFDDIENKLAAPGKPTVVFKDYPTETHHGWKYIAFGPDGKLYVPVGAPCNVCLSEKDIYASITRINPDGTGLEVVQHGIRNTVGFTWRPGTSELWFTDNGRDMWGDDMPSCELNVANHDGMHFGFPFCHQGDTLDTEFVKKGETCADYVPPVQKLGAHVAPLGLEFYNGNSFPQAYHNQLFVALHGSWNRSTRSGYQLELVRVENGKSVSHEPFATGWILEDDTPWGRPVDVEVLPDGSMLVSDDFADVIYRIYYKG